MNILHPSSLPRRPAGELASALSSTAPAGQDIDGEHYGYKCKRYPVAPHVFVPPLQTFKFLPRDRRALLTFS
jgi:hypothetical protein